jgi:hypothetical protein
MSPRSPEGKAFLRFQISWPIQLVVAAAFVLGIALRLWYLTHETLNSDGAVVGIQARAILHGHFTAFYPGQAYGGLGAYVTAPFVLILGPTALAISLPTVVLSGISAMLAWRIALRLNVRRSIAAMVGSLVWVAPLSTVLRSVENDGFRGVVMGCGLGCLLVSLRILDGKKSAFEFLALGSLTGLGWWASIEIAYLLLPSGLIILGAVARSRLVLLRTWTIRVGITLIGFGLSALPWLWANVSSGFASLKTGSFPGSSVPTSYMFRLETFFRHVVPGQFGLTQPNSGLDVVAPIHGPVFILLSAISALSIIVVVALRRGRSLAIVAGVVAFPFLYALQPGTWYWLDGRYAVFSFPLLAMVWAMAGDEVSWLLAPLNGSHSDARFGWLPSAAVGSLVLASCVLAAVGFSSSYAWNNPSASGYFRNWGSPEQSTAHVIDELKLHGVHYGYADYWVAYVLDYLSRGQLVITTIPPDTDREASLNADVSHAQKVAWLFIPPKDDTVAWWQFGATANLQGPGGDLSEGRFLQYLRATDVPYRIVLTGIIDAVIPEDPVTLPAGV